MSGNSANRRRKRVGIMLTRENATQYNLDGAILLWFVDFNTAAALTLAVAAQTVLDDIGRKKGKPSAVIDFINAQPKAIRRELRYPQTFLKHARNDPNVRIGLVPDVVELNIIDAVWSFQSIFGKLSPYMTAFALRFALENPGFFMVAAEHFAKALTKRVKIHEIAKLGRCDFLSEFMMREHNWPRRFVPTFTQLIRRPH
jgi:hypothetical protein